jgi:hypothetical protein
VDFIVFPLQQGLMFEYQFLDFAQGCRRNPFVPGRRESPGGGPGFWYCLIREDLRMRSIRFYLRAKG